MTATAFAGGSGGTPVPSAPGGGDSSPRRASRWEGAAPRLLVEPRARSLAEHVARHGPLPVLGGEAGAQELVTEVERSGLLGRGGAGFPTGRKLQAVRAQVRRAVVIANGTEGEPASAKDAVLLAEAPHLVLDGAVLAAEAVRAGEAVVVVRSELRAAVDAALDERTRAGCDPVRLRAVSAATGFVAGEASAVVSWVGGKRPLPHLTPPRLSERGLGGRPTLVQNVETLAQLALIARHGASWYREVGSEDEPGTMLVTAAGALRRPGVYEVPLGTSLGEVVEVAGGPSEPLGALLVGGYSGSWLPVPGALGLPLSRSGLRGSGASPGCGLVGALGRRRCGLAETAGLVRYLAGESAGQCGPCVYGLDAVAGELERLALGGRFDPFRLWRWLDQVEGRGACAHPDGVVRLVRSALAVFGEEQLEHERGWCTGASAEPTFPLGPRRVGSWRSS